MTVRLKKRRVQRRRKITVDFSRTRVFRSTYNVLADKIASRLTPQVEREIADMIRRLRHGRPLRGDPADYDEEWEHELEDLLGPDASPWGTD